MTTIGCGSPVATSYGSALPAFQTGRPVEEPLWVSDYGWNLTWQALQGG